MNKTLVAALALAGTGAVAWAGGQQVAAQVSRDGQSVVVRTCRCGAATRLFPARPRARLARIP